MSKVSDYINTFDINTEYMRIFHKELSDGNVFCPFHENTETPSAKVYDNVIYCFSCRRLYGTFDLLMRYDKERVREILSDKVIEEVIPSKSRSKVVKTDVTQYDGLFNKLKAIYDDYTKENRVQGR